MIDMVGLVIFAVGVHIIKAGSRCMAPETQADIWRRVAARLDADTKARIREALGE